MKFENTFEIPLTPGDAWPLLLDVRKIAPCVPGARLLEVVDPQTFKGSISVRLGPVTLTFNGIVRFENINPEARTVLLAATGADQKGRGGAQALTTIKLEEVGAGTSVTLVTNLDLTGSIAQYGRASGLVQQTAAHLARDFARNLSSSLEKSPTDEGTATRAPASSPLRLNTVLWALILRQIRRLIGRPQDSY